jgi:hypothetical protein
MKFLRMIAFATITSVLLVQSATAEVDFDYLLENRNEPLIKGYLVGFAHMLNSANANIKVDSGFSFELFCPPGNLILDDNDVLTAMKVAKARYGDSYPAQLAIGGFKILYPCN